MSSSEFTSRREVQKELDKLQIWAKQGKIAAFGGVAVVVDEENGLASVEPSMIVTDKSSLVELIGALDYVKSLVVGYMLELESDGH